VALQERTIQVFTFVGVDAPESHEKMMGLIAGFLLIRDEYYYFSAHNGYLDAGFRWHDEYDIDYGTPVGEPVATVDKGSGGVVYTRAYSHCSVHVSCTGGAKLCDGWVNMTAPAS
jgi:hypothetical protein